MFVNVWQGYCNIGEKEYNGIVERTRGAEGLLKNKSPIIPKITTFWHKIKIGIVEYKFKGVPHKSGAPFFILYRRQKDEKHNNTTGRMYRREDQAGSRDAV